MKQKLFVLVVLYVLANVVTGLAADPNERSPSWVSPTPIRPQDASLLRPQSGKAPLERLSEFVPRRSTRACKCPDPLGITVATGLLAVTLMNNGYELCEYSLAAVFNKSKRLVKCLTRRQKVTGTRNEL